MNNIKPLRFNLSNSQYPSPWTMKVKAKVEQRKIDNGIKFNPVSADLNKKLNKAVEFANQREERWKIIAGKADSFSSDAIGIEEYLKVELIDDTKLESTMIDNDKFYDND